MKPIASEMMLLCGKCYIDQKSFGKWYIVQNIPFGITKQPDNSFDVDFQGSDDARAWFRDFIIWPIVDSVLGQINGGQAIGMDAVIEAIIQAIPDKTSVIRISGHSKGASMAILVAGKLYKKYGYTNISVFAFEPARVAHIDNTILPEIFKTVPILITQNEYGGRQDIVPNAPPNYIHPASATIICCPGVSFDPTLDMALHHWQIVYVGVVLWERQQKIV